MRALILLVLFSFLISACSTGKKFTSRKYTSGRYVSYAKHQDKPNSSVSKKEKIVENLNNTGTPAIVEQNESNVIEKSGVIFEDKKGNNPPVKLLNTLHKTQLSLQKNKAVNVFQKKENNSDVFRRKVSSEGKTSSKSLLSVFLGAGGLTLEVVGFILTVALAEYIFMALIAAGLALGIVGLIMGIMGIKQYKEDKRNGEKRRSTLILGIIGTALGGAAIFFALYFSILSVIFVEAGF